MAVTDAVESAEDVRKSGNELYKAGKLLEAVARYKRAAELAPSTEVPARGRGGATAQRLAGDYAVQAHGATDYPTPTASRSRSGSPGERSTLRMDSEGVVPA